MGKGKKNKDKMEQEKPDVDKDTSKNTVIVRSLDESVTSKQLEDIFGDCGPIRRCFVVYQGSGNNKKSRGMAFVQFALDTDAMAAVEQFNGHELSGKNMVVQMAKRRASHDQRWKERLEKKEADKQFSTERDFDDESDDESDEEDDDDKDEEKEEEEEDKADDDDDEMELDPSRVASSSTSNGSGFNKEGKPVMSAEEVREHRRGRKTLVIENIPKKIKLAVMEKKCKEAANGLVEVAFLKRGKDDKTRVAHAEYESVFAAREAWGNLHDKYLNSNDQMKVRFLEEPKPKRCRLIVRNLAFRVKEVRLRREFGEFGYISEVVMPTDAKGRFKGYAFIQYVIGPDAIHAIKALNGKEIKGRTIAVDWCVAREDYQKSLEVQGGALVMNDDDDDDQKEGQDDEEESDDDEEDEEEEEEESESDSDSDSESESESDSEDEVPVEERYNDVQHGTTVFIRNLSYDTSEAGLYRHFRQFGEIKFCKVVMDRQSGRSRGTGFVQFNTVPEVKACLAAAQQESQEDQQADDFQDKINRLREKGEKKGRKALTMNANGNQGNDGGIWLDGRLLSVVLAVDRKKAEELALSGKAARKAKDKRNLYLADEGTIDINSEMAKKLPEEYMQKRIRSAKIKREKLSNPNFFVSKTRLSWRNLPKDVDEKGFRQIVIDSLNELEIKDADIREVLIARERDRGDKKSKEKGKKKGKEIKASKIGKSKGYGFIELDQHEHALKLLRHLNNNPNVLGANWRPIVEFSVEDKRALHILEQIKATKEKQRQKARDEIQKVKQQNNSASQALNNAGGVRAAKRRAKNPQGRPERRNNNNNSNKNKRRGKGVEEEHEYVSQKDAYADDSKKREIEKKSNKDAKRRRLENGEYQKRGKQMDKETSWERKQDRAAERSAQRSMKKEKSKHQAREDGDEFDKMVNEYKNKVFGKKKVGERKKSRWFE